MRDLSAYLKERFGEKVYKLSLSSGCTCPNRDGTIGVGGCTFCSEGGSGEFAAAQAPIDVQIEEAKRRVRQKTDAARFIAYFQAYTNTYGDIKRLRELYLQTIRRDEIAVLSLGTRPDCIPDEMMELLMELRAIKPVWVELGLQTIHEETAARICRGYALPVSEEAFRKLKDAGIEVIVHVILNLPGETREDMLETIRYLAALQPEPDGVKLQMLQILKGTTLAEEYEKEPFPLMDLETYADLISECVSILPEKTVLHRMTGDGPRRLLIAPLWSLEKRHVLNTLRRKLSDCPSPLHYPG